MAANGFTWLQSSMIRSSSDYSKPQFVSNKWYLVILVTDSNYLIAFTTAGPSKKPKNSHCWIHYKSYNEIVPSWKWGGQLTKWIGQLGIIIYPHCTKCICSHLFHFSRLTLANAQRQIHTHKNTFIFKQTIWMRRNEPGKYSIHARCPQNLVCPYH